MKGWLMVLMETLVHQKKSLVWTLVKQTQNFVWVYITTVTIVNCLLMGKKIYQRKAYNKNVNFSTQFCLENISNVFGAADSREVSLKGNVYNYSFDYNAVDKSDILNIHKKLMVKNNIKK